MEPHCQQGTGVLWVGIPVPLLGGTCQVVPFCSELYSLDPLWDSGVSSLAVPQSPPGPPGQDAAGRKVGTASQPPQILTTQHCAFPWHFLACSPGLQDLVCTGELTFPAHSDRAGQQRADEGHGANL